MTRDAQAMLSAALDEIDAARRELRIGSDPEAARRHMMRASALLRAAMERSR